MCVLTLGCHCGTLASCCRVEAMPEAASRSELNKETIEAKAQWKVAARSRCGADKAQYFECFHHGTALTRSPQSANKIAIELILYQWKGTARLRCTTDKARKFKCMPLTSLPKSATDKLRHGYGAARKMHGNLNVFIHGMALTRSPKGATKIAIQLILYNYEKSWHGYSAAQICYCCQFF